MDGYFTSYGYVGRVGDTYMLFATEDEYLEIIEDNEKENDE